MNLYLDTEFTGFDRRQADLISIAVLDDNGRLFYGEFVDVNWDVASDFVLDQVKPKLGRAPLWKTELTTYVILDRREMRPALETWLSAYKGKPLIWWADVAAYDWVYTMDWLAKAEGGNAYVWAQEQGLDMPYYPRDLVEKLPAEINRLEKAREIIKTTEGQEHIRTLLQQDNQHAAWADAVILSFLVPHLHVTT